MSHGTAEMVCQEMFSPFIEAAVESIKRYVSDETALQAFGTSLCELPGVVVDSQDLPKLTFTKVTPMALWGIWFMYNPMSRQPECAA